MLANKKGHGRKHPVLPRRHHVPRRRWDLLQLPGGRDRERRPGRHVKDQDAGGDGTYAPGHVPKLLKRLTLQPVPCSRLPAQANALTDPDSPGHGQADIRRGPWEAS